MDPLSITASIIAVLQLTSKVIEYLESVKDAPKDRAQCAIEASNLYNLLTTLRYRIEDSTSHEPWYAQVRVLLTKNGPFDQYKTALERLQTKINPGKLKSTINVILWKHVKTEVMEIISQIERLKSLVHIALDMDHFELSRAIKSSVDSVQRHQKSLQDEELLEWISPADFIAQQHDLISRRQAGTGLWFLGAPEYTKWIQGSEKTLFCPGIPGAGKSMMAAIAIDHLLKQMKSARVGVAFLFFNYKTKIDQVAMFSALLRQMLQQMSTVPDSIKDLFEQHKRQQTRLFLEEVLACLQSLLTSDYSSVYLVVDALDEYTDAQSTCSQFLKSLFYLQSKVDVHIMATSRFIPDIMANFSSALTLEVRASNSDIEEYVKGHIHLLPHCVQRNEALQERIQQTLAEAVDGMFLLARLYFDSLLDKNTKKKIDQALENLSKKGSSALHQAYDEAIKRIESQLPGRRDLAKQVLSWVTYAERPLTIQELCHALAIEPGEEELDSDNIPDAEDLVSVCAGLITIDRESGIFRLFHYTTQEYLEQIRESWLPTSQRDLAESCLTYLAFENFTVGPCASPAELHKRLEEHPFYSYATQYWGNHALTVQEDVSELALSFLQNDKLISNILQLHDTHWDLNLKHSMRNRSYPPPDYPKQSNGLHLLARLGLLHFSKILVDTLGTASVKSVDSRGRTALYYAANHGHESLVRFLLSHQNVSAAARDYYGSSPLTRAAAKGHYTIVQLLLVQEHNEPDFMCKTSSLALSEAAAKGHEAVVQLLIEKGNKIDINIKDHCGDTPLSRAAGSGHERVVNLLLQQKDININSTNNAGVTPLWCAAGFGRTAIVKLLLEQDDMDMNSKDIGNINLLSIAASEGFHEVVELLINYNGVEVDSRDFEGKTPLSRAAQGGHPSTVKLLLGCKDVEADSMDHKYRTPLVMAFSPSLPPRNVEVVRLLLESGRVRADIKDDCGRTALSFAAEEGHLDLVQLLIEKHDVETDSKDIYDRTPLSYAADCGHAAVVEMLLEQCNVQVDSRDEFNRTPLWYAAYYGDEAVAKLLLAHKSADTDVKDNWGLTPLSIAAEKGHEEIIKLLLLENSGVDPDSRDNLGCTPLLRAARGCHEGVVKILLEQGKVKANLKANSGRTPLFWAAVRGHFSIVELLLRQDDVDANSRDDFGKTPLFYAAYGGNEAVVKLLLDKYNAEANPKDQGGKTPLFEAAHRGHERVVSLLISRSDVDVNWKDNEGMTALSHAAVMRHLQVLRLLLEQNAQADSRDHSGRTPLRWAVAGGCVEIVDLLISHQTKFESDLKDSAGLTPLCWSAIEDRLEVAMMLLQKYNVEVDSKSKNGRTPLSWAAAEGANQVARLLLEHGAQPDSRDDKGRSPLSWAAEAGNREVVRLLLDQSDVKADSEDDEGETPLSYAEVNGHVKVAKMLAERLGKMVELRVRWSDVDTIILTRY